MIKISPSLLSSDVSDLKKVLVDLKEANCDYAHLDVMDGHFVNNLTFGPCFASSLAKLNIIPLDIHLMISEPMKYLDKFAPYGEFITLHIETLKEDEIIKAKEIIHSYNHKFALTLRPSTPLEKVLPYVKDIDMLLIMSVEPGFSGQKFIPSMLERIDEVNKYKRDHNLSFLIEVDGGVNGNNYEELIKHNVDILVSGSYIFSNNMKDVVSKMKRS